MARPTVYTTELLQKARKYAEGGWRENGEVVPTLAGLAVAIGVTKETCRVWKKDPQKVEFSAFCSSIQQQQEMELVNRGLVGDFAAPITKMMMTKHGYSDRIEQDHQSSDGTMSPPSRIEIVAPGESEG